MDIAVNILLTIATAATPLLIAAIGELVVERSGVLNLGVEGMMIMGAVGGFGAAYLTGSPWVGLLAAIALGALFSLLFAFMTLTLATNQVATGLSLTLLGLGLSGMMGTSFVGLPGERLPNLDIPGLTSIPVVGRLLFGQDPIFYISIALTAAVMWFLFRTRTGLTLRSIGDSHASAHALGISVIGYRYLAVIFGGACAGLAGGHLSLVYTPQWVENMSAGRGWIALALVVLVGIAEVADRADIDPAGLQFFLRLGADRQRQGRRRGEQGNKQFLHGVTSLCCLVCVDVQVMAACK